MGRIADSGCMCKKAVLALLAGATSSDSFKLPDSETFLKRLRIFQSLRQVFRLSMIPICIFRPLV